MYDPQQLNRMVEMRDEADKLLGRLSLLMVEAGDTANGSGVDMLRRKLAQQVADSLHTHARGQHVPEAPVAIPAGTMVRLRTWAGGLTVCLLVDDYRPGHDVRITREDGGRVVVVAADRIESVEVSQ